MAAPVTVVIDNSLIGRMLNDPARFGWLTCLQLKTVTGAIGCCGGKRTTIDFTGIKNCLAGLDTMNIERLRGLLGAAKLQISRTTVHRGKPAVVRHVR